MGKKRGRFLKVNKIPPHRGPVILRSKATNPWWGPLLAEALVKRAWPKSKASTT